MEDSSDDLALISSIDLPSLTSEALTNVLAKLPLKTIAFLSCTSKYFHDFAHQPQFWHSVRLTKPPGPAALATLCAKGRFIKNLSLDFSKEPPQPSILTLLSNSCTSLVSISLSYTSTHYKVNNQFPHEYLKGFLMQSKTIRKLRFMDQLSLDDFSLNSMLPYMQSMTSINLSGCGSLTDSSLIRLAQQCPSLRSLDISKIPITGRCIEHFFRYCNSLETLRVNECLELQKNSFDKVQQDDIHRLKELSIIGTTVDLSHFLHHCVHLTRLYISRSNDSLLIPFLMKARRLEVLYVGSGSKATISTLLTTIGVCRKLKSLTFHSHIDFAVPSDECLRLICAGCPRLESLSLNNCGCLSTFWIIKLLETLPLVSLSLFGWTRCNSAVLRLIAPHVGGLRMFAISDAKKIKEDGVARFVKEAKKLKVLKLENCNLDEAKMLELLPQGTTVEGNIYFLNSGG